MKIKSRKVLIPVGVVVVVLVAIAVLVFPAWSTRQGTTRCGWCRVPPMA